MRSTVACLLLWAHPVALLLLSPRQPLLARPLRQPLRVRRSAPLLQEESPKSESSKGELVPSGDVVATGETRILTAADEEVVGNLVEDEEWLGLGTEMFIVLRSSLRESLKKNTRDFTGSEECAPEVPIEPGAASGPVSVCTDACASPRADQLGDLSKEADKRIKDEVAKHV